MAWHQKYARWCWLIMASLMFILPACSKLQDSNTAHFETKQGQASLRPIQQTKTLYFADSTDARLRYMVKGSLKVTQAVDILLLFDRTKSMKREIDETAKAADVIVNDIQSEAPNTRFAVAAVSDYSPLFTPATDKRTWLVLSDFTKSARQIKKATERIALSNGGDNPEAYSRGLYEAAQMQWRPEAKKIILFFGDSIDHPIDPGRDETLGTDDDLTITLVLKALNAKQIQVVGIYTSKKRIVKAFFEKITAATAGHPIPLEDASKTGQVIVESIKDSLQQQVSLTPKGSQQSWLTVNTSARHLKEKDFHISIRPPADVAAGVYNLPLTFDLEETGKQSGTLTTNQEVSIKVITGWYNHPLLLWLPLIALIALLVWQAFKMLGGGFARTYHVRSRRRNVNDIYSIMHLVIDVLALLALLVTPLAIYLCYQGLVLSQLLS